MDTVSQLSNLGIYPKISVVDSSVVWIAGSGTSHRIYRTVNGGSNWTQIPTGTLPFWLTGVAAKDSLTGS